MAQTPRPFGRGPYGAGPFGPGAIELGGICFVTFDAYGLLTVSWRQPAVCATGTWTVVRLPELEPA